MKYLNNLSSNEESRVEEVRVPERSKEADRVEHKEEMTLAENISADEGGVIGRPVI